MSQIILDLSGSKGLADNFHGNYDEITSLPQSNLNVKEGQMAQGLFNPYIRKGYLHPAPSSTVSYTVSTTPTEQFSSVEYDSDSKFTFWGARDNYIYVGLNHDDTTISRQITLDSGDVVQDLQLYEYDRVNSLYYTVSRDKIYPEVTFTDLSKWVSLTVGLDSTGYVAVTNSFEYYSSNRTDHEFTAELTDDVVYLFFYSTQPIASSTSVDVNSLSNNMTLITSQEYEIAGGTQYFYLYKDTSTHLINKKNTFYINLTSAGRIFVQGVSLKGVDTSTPGCSYVFNKGVGTKARSVLDVEDGMTFLNFIWTDKFRTGIDSLGTETTYNVTPQTLGYGSAVYISPDGTKMYVDGYDGSLPNKAIFQYTLSTAWDITTATYVNKFRYTTGSSSFFQKIFFSPDGTKVYYVYSYGSGGSIYYRTLSTAWDITTAGGASSTSFPPGYIYDFTFNSDGTKLFTVNSDGNSADQHWLREYTLSTAYDLSTKTLVNKTRTDGRAEQVFISPDDTTLGLRNNSDYYLYLYSFNSLYPYDVTKLTLIKEGLFTTDPRSAQISNTFFEYLYIRDINNDNVIRYELGTSNYTTISSLARELQNETTYVTKPMASYWYPNQRVIDVGVFPISHLMDNTTVDPTPLKWLTEIKDEYIHSSSDYNFLRNADNGFTYLFTGNKISKIDNSVTGGKEGNFLKNVILFPDYFTITDAVDYRGFLYVALHETIVSQSTISPDTRPRRCGVFIWDRVSTSFDNTNYIYLPGVKEIRKIYISPDQVIKMIVVSENGLTEVREFGYNDSGASIYRTIKTLGVGAYPKYPDGLTTVGDMVVWLANDAYVYSEKGGDIVQLHKVSQSIDTSADSKSNLISSGALLYGDGTGYDTTGFNEYKRNIAFSYKNSSGVYVKNLSLLDKYNIDNSFLFPMQGDVYSAVTILPVTSVLRSIRILNLPYITESTSTLATIKVYFNQSTNPTMPYGLTKTITAKDAAKGYIEIKIDKPNIHAVQVEVEWATDVALSYNPYTPSVAIITYDETKTSSPDND